MRGAGTGLWWVSGQAAQQNIHWLILVGAADDEWMVFSHYIEVSKAAQHWLQSRVLNCYV